VEAKGISVAKSLGTVEIKEARNKTYRYKKSYGFKHTRV
jgi:hypothetical protein